MNQKPIEHIKELLILLMNHLFYISLLLMLMGVIGYKTSHIFLWIALIIVPYYFHFLHAYIENSVLKVVLHFLAPLAAFMIKTSTTAKVLMMIVICFYIVFSLRRMLTALLHPKAFAALVGFFLVVENLHTKNGWGTYYLGAALIYLICYIILHFLNQYTEFITMNECSASNIPKREIFQSGVKHTGFFAGIALLTALPIAFFDWTSGISSSFVDFFLLLVKKFIFWLQTIDVTESENNIGNPSGTIPLDSLSFENNETLHKFWRSLDQILPVIMIILLVIGVLFVTYTVFKLLKDNLHWFKGRKKATKILSNEDLREQCEIDAISGNEFRTVFFGDNRTKIRRLYKKRVLKSKETIIGNRNVNELNYMTAKECCDALSENGLKNIYEKAKYSSEKITLADIKSAK